VTINNLEIEVKLRVSSVEQIRNNLLQHGFTLKKARYFERNMVFDYKDMTLRANDRLLRLRSEGEEVKLTFKKPFKQAEPGRIYKVREEIELEVGDFNKMRLVLENLGFSVVFIYEKYREIFIGENVLVMIDETPIGDYIEIEASVEKIDEAAGRLGFSRDEYIADNYHTLFRRAGQIGDMIFED
jgi:adenylate cyclase class 2